MANSTKRGRVPREDVVKAILSGIRKAHKEYFRMSGGIWMGDGPEYWITTYVAKSLWNLCGDGTVVAEKNSSEMMSNVGRKSGRPSFLVKNKRFDIALYFAKGEPRAAIEIKRQTQRQKSYGTVLKDVDKVLTALRKSRLNFGIVAYYYSATVSSRNSAIKEVKNYANTLNAKAKEKAAKYKFSTEFKSSTFVNADDAWLAGCILLERKQGNKRG